MAIYKRKNSPYWYYRVWVGNREFRGSTQETNRKKAEAVEREEAEKAREAVRLSPPRNGGGGPVTFGQACAEYWDQKGRFRTDASKLAWSLDWLKHPKRIGEQRLLRDIDDKLIGEVVAMRRGERRRYGEKGELVGPSTVNRSVVDPLRSILVRAAKIHKVTLDIEWPLHRLAEPDGRVRELKDSEESALFADDGLRADYQPAVLFAIRTGCRLNEIIKLVWSDVDWGNRQIIIRGKGSRGKGPKSKPIPMPPSVREIIWPLQGRHPERVFTYVAQKTRDGRKKGEHYPLTESGLSSLWRRLKKRIKLVDYRFHDNRHTTATRILRKGGHLKTVQVLLRHEDAETSMRYAHVTADDVEAAMERANRHTGPAHSTGTQHKDEDFQEVG